MRLISGYDDFLDNLWKVHDNLAANLEKWFSEFATVNSHCVTVHGMMS